MPLSSPTNILVARARLGECPLWDSDRHLLFWVDIYNHRVHQFDPVSGDNCFFNVGDVVGAIGLAGEQRLIMAQRHRLAFLDLVTGQVNPICSVEADRPKNRCNDGKCDAQGRFWFGSTSEHPGEANLYRYDPDGSLHLMETGLTIANGLGWSPDQTTFYLTDSALGVIYAYDFEATLGQIHNRRVFVDVSESGYQPDGLTIDAAGYLWSALWDGWSVVRYDPQGREVMRVAMPVQRPTACTFGGSRSQIAQPNQAQLTELYITTAAVGLSEQEIEASFEAGDLFGLSTSVKGLPAYHFGQV